MIRCPFRQLTRRSKVFYLVSHDIGDELGPRLCSNVRQEAVVLRKEQYCTVNIEPSINMRLYNRTMCTIDEVVFGIVPGKIQDVGRKNVLADVVICPTYINGVVDERHCANLGVATLHASRSEALRMQ